MIGQALLRITFALGLVALVTGCAEMEPPATTTAPAPTPPQGYWNGDSVPGSPKIVVSIAEQRAYFFKGKNLVGETTVSTGKPGFGTPPGQYTVLSKDATHVSTVFGDYVDDAGNVVKSNIDSRKDSRPKGSHYDGARMPFAMFFRGGYAMHQGYVPPYAASHGCIRIPQSMAETFFNAASVGTPVIVKQEAVVHSVPVPAVDTVPPPAPYPVRYTAPPSVRPAQVRSTVSNPSPVPLRSPAPVLSRKPAPLQSPVPLQTASPFPLRSSGPPPVRPTSLRSTVPAPTPIPLRSPAPALSRTSPPGPLHSPSPAPLRSLAPSNVRTSAPTSVQPKPTPTPLSPRSKKHARSRTHNAPKPSPTPSPAR
jgi:L,D-transpeptidase catalytic domain